LNSTFYVFLGIEYVKTEIKKNKKLD
jgi:hypothetical protein